MNKRREKAQSSTRLSGRAAAVCGAVLFVMALASPAIAYVGPGAGLGTQGALLILILVVLVMVVGLVLWPLRMLIRYRKAKVSKAELESRAPSTPRQAE
jgi:hypothetical protein